MQDTEAFVLRVTGMHCGNCSGRVQRALLAVPGTASAVVDLAAGSAVVVTSSCMCDLVDAVEGLGFGASELAQTIVLRVTGTLFISWLIEPRSRCSARASPPGDRSAHGAGRHALQELLRARRARAPRRGRRR